MGRRVHAGTFDVSGASHRPAPGRDRRDLPRRVFGRESGLGAVNQHASEIADHLLKAKSFANGERLVRYLILAGRSALHAAAFEEAQRNFKTALPLQGADDSAERANSLANLAQAERGLERRDETISHLREALEIYLKLDDHELVGENFAELIDVLLCI